MARITIVVSDDDVKFIEQEISAGRASSQTEAIALIIRDSRKLRGLEELGRLATEGIESGEAIPVTPAYWRKKKEALRARLRSRAKRNKSGRH